MSIIKVDNIRDNGTGFNDVVSFQNANGTENGRLCRAFCNFNGQGAIAIRANFNVNSLTDHATGDYTVTFSNSLSDGNYVLAGCTIDQNATFATFLTTRDPSVQTSGSCRVLVWNYNGGYVDAPGVMPAFFR